MSWLIKKSLAFFFFFFYFRTSVQDPSTNCPYLAITTLAGCGWDQRSRNPCALPPAARSHHAAAQGTAAWGTHGWSEFPNIAVMGFAWGENQTCRSDAEGYKSKGQYFMPPALPGLWILASKPFYRNAGPQAKLAKISCAPSSAGGNGFLFCLLACFL